MAARRQPSTTSLSKYARAHTPDPENKSLDFCNAFWGAADGGVDVLFARLRGAQRTVDELRNYWKERAVIEEDYAKRLAKLARLTLGRDEIGELRNSFETLRTETDKQATFHLQLANQIREVEGQTATMLNKQVHHKKVYQSAIEKEFKAKQTQEAYVTKAREKYESDCLRINSYTAQSTLVQGKDLEKITLKLERAQQTVQANERDFANFAKALADTTQKWELDWKSFCDLSQDLEEERLEFLKDNMWAYANAVSMVCVSDDESCEKMRLSLEQVEAEKEMENFVQDYGTGNQIPDPPAFVNYNTPDAIPSSASRPTYRPANFTRSSSRMDRRPTPVSVEEEPLINTAGIGAGGGSRRGDVPPEGTLNRKPTLSKARAAVNQALASQTPEVNGINGNAPASSPQPQQPLSRRSTVSRSAPAPQSSQPSRMPHDPHAEPIDPTAETYIKVGSNAYKVDLSKDPQQGFSSQQNKAPTTLGVGRSDGIDPLAKHMEDLQNAVTNSGSIRRSGVYKLSPQQEPSPSPIQTSPRKAATLPAGGSTSLSLPAPSASPAGGVSQPTPVRDYRNSAEIVVGAHPSVSRPASPRAPTPVFMMPKNPTSPIADNVVDVVADYQQSFPGEHKSISRRASYNGPPPGTGPSQSPSSHAGHVQNQSQGQNLARPSSQVGHAGIGAHGGSRSNSPQPISRGPSPAPGADGRRNTYMPPSQALAMVNAGAGNATQRAVSPNNVGIVLDPSGRVLHDEMAQRYQQRQQQPPPQPQVQQGYGTGQRRPSYMAPANPAMTPGPAQPVYSVPPNQPGYGVPAGGPVYQPPSQPSYMPPQHPPPQAYTPTPTAYQPPPAQQPMYGQQPYGNVYGRANGIQRAMTTTGVPYGNGMQTQRQVQQQHAYRAPSPQPPVQHQAPPTGQTTEDGLPILFYVKALYDYTATIDEEFDFQAGDIIAVIATPEDGWWSGELLDERRRQKGRHVFPSNFVCLF